MRTILFCTKISESGYVDYKFSDSLKICRSKVQRDKGGYFFIHKKEKYFLKDIRQELKAAAKKTQMPPQLQMALDKFYMETKVKYVDPDYTAAQDLKARTIEANKKFEAYKKGLEEDKFETFTWGESQ